MAWALALLALACAVLVWLWLSTARRLDEARRMLDDRAAELAKAEDQIARLEDVIDAKQRELRSLANDLAACTDPRVAVDLAVGLLRDPWRGAPPVPR